MNDLKRFRKKSVLRWTVVAFMVVPASCGDSFLEAKPDSSLLIPATLEDCQKILDDTGVALSNFPVSGVLASDEYTLDYQFWLSHYSPYERNTYLWADDLYEGQRESSDWDYSFSAIYHLNAVLETLDDIPITEDNKTVHDNLKGSALFHRAYRYFSLSEVFTLPYQSTSAESTLGLPIRKSADIDEISDRTSLKETYDFILDDFNIAVALLKESGPDFRLHRPSKAAAFGALAKVYLTMGDFGNALKNAEDCLAHHDLLKDYNELNTEENFNFTNNPEIIFGANRAGSAFLYPYPRANGLHVDKILFDLYGNNDLRKTAFFIMDIDGAIKRKYLYSYDGLRLQCFGGIATNEILLIKAECLARLNRVDEAQETLAKLLSKRFITDTYQPQQFDSSNELLNVILEERRKELVFSGARWGDVRRLNAAGENIQMSRTLNGQTYSIIAGSNKFAFPIPPNEIDLAGLIQNPR